MLIHSQVAFKIVVKCNNSKERELFVNQYHLS